MNNVKIVRFKKYPLVTPNKVKCRYKKNQVEFATSKIKHLVTQISFLTKLLTVVIKQNIMHVLFTVLVVKM